MMASPNGAAVSNGVANLTNNGFVPLPITPGTKACEVTGWRRGAIKPTDWFNEAGVGVLCGFGDLVTIDPDHVEHVDAAIIDAINAVVPLGCPRAKGRSGPNIFVRAKVAKKVSIPVGFAVIDGKWTACKVELLTHGQQTVIPPSVHPETGQPYQWVPGPDGVVRSLYDMHIDTVPRVAGDLDALLKKALAAWVVPTKLVNACKAISAAADGERNDTFNDEVFKLAKGEEDIPEPLARKWLTLAAHHAGLTEAETAATFKSAAEAGSERPGGGKGR